MGLISAKQAMIDGIQCLREATVETRGFDNAVACGDSGGAMIRAPSNKDWRGLAVGFGHTPPKLPGETFQLTLLDSGDNGWETDETDGAIVDRVHIFNRAQESQIFYYHIYFSAANGPLTPGDYATISATVPTPYASAQNQVNIATVDRSTGQWELDIRSNNTPPVWPSDGDGWPNRDEGNVDCIIKWDEYFNSAAGLADVNDQSIFKLYVEQAVGTASATFWEIKWAQVLAMPVSYIMGDEDGRPHYVTVKDGEARFASAVGGVTGHIKRPDLTTYWP